MKKLSAFVIAFVCFACSSDEPDCALDHVISGSIYEAVEPLIEAENEEIEYYLHSGNVEDREEALPLCDPQTFSSILPLSFQARLDSAYINHCDECIEVIEWTGPGCPLESETRSDLATFHHTHWRIAHLEFPEAILYPPCDLPMNAVFYADGTFELKITSQQEGRFEFDNQVFRIVEISEVLGFFNGGYLGLFEHQLRGHLYEDLSPLQVSLEENELVFSRESPSVRIVLIR